MMKKSELQIPSKDFEQVVKHLSIDRIPCEYSGKSKKDKNKDKLSFKDEVTKEKAKKKIAALYGPKINKEVEWKDWDSVDESEEIALSFKDFYFAEKNKETK